MKTTHQYYLLNSFQNDLLWGDNNSSIHYNENDTKGLQEISL